jgi:hypothetical protein
VNIASVVVTNFAFIAHYPKRWLHIRISRVIIAKSHVLSLQTVKYSSHAEDKEKSCKQKAALKSVLQ